MIRNQSHAREVTRGEEIWLQPRNWLHDQSECCRQLKGMASKRPDDTAKRQSQFSGQDVNAGKTERGWRHQSCSIRPRDRHAFPGEFGGRVVLDRQSTTTI
jgi:hypothetical protein